MNDFQRVLVFFKTCTHITINLSREFTRTNTVSPQSFIIFLSLFSRVFYLPLELDFPSLHLSVNRPTNRLSVLVSIAGLYRSGGQGRRYRSSLRLHCQRHRQSEWRKCNFHYATSCRHEERTAEP